MTEVVQKVKRQETRIATEPLNFDIHLEESWIYVGNSGLELLPGTKGFLMNFRPDGVDQPSPENSYKFTLIFAASFLEFLSWWREKKATELNIPQLVSNGTNTTMSHLRQRLFGDAYQQSEPRPNQKNIFYQIDLEKVANTPQTLAYLKLLSDRCKASHFQMKI